MRIEPKMKSDAEIVLDKEYKQKPSIKFDFKM
jgi:hypothetical protein